MNRSIDIAMETFREQNRKISGKESKYLLFGNNVE